MEWSEVRDVVGRPAQLDVSHRWDAVEGGGHSDLVEK